jgi:S1-C subfamily serine protease
VVSGGPAEKTGIEQKDVIVEFDGKEATALKDLPWIVASTPGGKAVPEINLYLSNPSRQRSHSFTSHPSPSNNYLS